MPFVPRNTVRHPRPVGRPPTPIPAPLAEILAGTLERNQAWTEDITDTDDGDLHKLLKLGDLYAQRRGLSFRYRINDDPERGRELTMWLCAKQKYVRRSA